MSDTSIYFDLRAIHPEAARSLDSAGQELLQMASRRALRPTDVPTFESRRQPQAHFTDADLVGASLSEWCNIAGQTTARYFVQDGIEIALADEGYKSLRKLVEKLNRTPPFGGRLSQKFLEEQTFIWWRNVIRGETDRPLTAAILEKAATVVREHEILVPLSHLEIQDAFYFGDTLLTPFDADFFDGFGEQLLKSKPELTDMIGEQRAKLKRQLGHLTGVSIKVIGDLDLALNKARAVAFDMASVIRFMSPAALSWNVIYPCFPKGCEHIRMITQLQIENDEISTLSDGVIDNYFDWKLTTEYTELLMSSGFKNCALFFEAASLSSFQQRVKTAIFSYAEGIASFNTSNRLVFTMSALEHLLLKDEKESIQAAVGDRMAFLLAKGADDRMAIVTNFKKAYGYRSQQVHHLTSVDDEEVLAKFFQNAWQLIMGSIRAMPRYKDHKDFLDGIDAIKYGGG